MAEDKNTLHLDNVKDNASIVLKPKGKGWSITIDGELQKGITLPENGVLVIKGEGKGISIDTGAKGKKQGPTLSNQTGHEIEVKGCFNAVDCKEAFTKDTTLLDLAQVKGYDGKLTAKAYKLSVDDNVSEKDGVQSLELKVPAKHPKTGKTLPSQLETDSVDKGGKIIYKVGNKPRFTFDGDTSFDDNSKKFREDVQKTAAQGLGAGLQKRGKKVTVNIPGEKPTVTFGETKEDPLSEKAETVSGKTPVEMLEAFKKEYKSFLNDKKDKPFPKDIAAAMTAAEKLVDKDGNIDEAQVKKFNEAIDTAMRRAHHPSNVQTDKDKEFIGKLSGKTWGKEEYRDTGLNKIKEDTNKWIEEKRKEKAKGRDTSMNAPEPDNISMTPGTAGGYAQVATHYAALAAAAAAGLPKTVTDMAYLAVTAIKTPEFAKTFDAVTQGLSSKADKAPPTTQVADNGSPSLGRK